MAQVYLYSTTLEVIAKCQLKNDRKKVVIDTFAAGVKFDPATTYTIDLEQDFVKETEGSKFPNPAVTGLGQFTTNFTGPQVQTETPSGNNVTNNTSITYTYDRQLLAGNGNYYLYRETGSPDEEVAVFNASDSTGRSTISGNQITLDVTGFMRAGETYYTLIDEGAVEDKDGLAAFGFDNDQEHRWTTATTDFPDLSAVMTDAFAPTIAANITVNPFTTMNVTATVYANGGRLLDPGTITMSSQFTTNLLGVTWVFYSNMTVTANQSTATNYIANHSAQINTTAALTGFAGFVTIQFAETNVSSNQYLYDTTVIDEVDATYFPIFSSGNTNTNGGWVGTPQEYRIQKITSNREKVLVPIDGSRITGGVLGTSNYSEIALLKENSSQTDYEIDAVINVGFIQTGSTNYPRYCNGAITDDGKIMVLLRQDKDGSSDFQVVVNYNETPFSDISYSPPQYANQNPTPQNGGGWIVTQFENVRNASGVTSNFSTPRCQSIVLSGDGEYLAYQATSEVHIWRRDRVGPSYPSYSDPNYYKRGQFRDYEDEIYKYSLGYFDPNLKIVTNSTGSHFIFVNHYSGTSKRQLRILTNTSGTTPDVDFTSSFIAPGGVVQDYFIEDNGTEIWLKWLPDDISQYNFNTGSSNENSQYVGYISLFKYVNNQWIEAQRITSVDTKAYPTSTEYGFNRRFKSYNLNQSSVDDVVMGYAGLTTTGSTAGRFLLTINAT